MRTLLLVAALLSVSCSTPPERPRGSGINPAALREEAQSAKRYKVRAMSDKSRKTDL